MQRAHLLSRLVDPSEAQLSRLTHGLLISSFTTGKPRKKHLISLLHITLPIGHHGEDVEESDIEYAGHKGGNMVYQSGNMEAGEH